MPTSRLADSIAIVTGAGSGIGQAIAVGFSREGARVACADIRGERADATAERIRSAGGEALAVAVDVSEREQVETMLARTVDRYGAVDVLVSAAGISARDHFLEVSDESWDRVLAVNLKGLFLCGQVVGRHMAERGRGAIINVTSQLSEVAQPHCAPYLASKGGGKLLTKAMAVDLARSGVRVNALAPGLTNTNLSPRETEEGRRYLAETCRHIPMGRQAEPEEMVGAAIYLASPEASYVTGTTLVVDGGYLAI